MADDTPNRRAGKTEAQRRAVAEARAAGLAVHEADLAHLSRGVSVLAPPAVTAAVCEILSRAGTRPRIRTLPLRRPVRGPR